jgi:hypothetical protein
VRVGRANELLIDLVALDGRTSLEPGRNPANGS